MRERRDGMRLAKIRFGLLAALVCVLAVLTPDAAHAHATCPSAAVGETLNITTSGGVTTCTNIGTAKATEGIEIFNNLFSDYIPIGFGGGRFGVAFRKVTSSGNEQPTAAGCVGACFSFQPGDVFDEDTPIASSAGVAADWGYGTGTVTLVQCAAWSYSSSNAAGCTVSFQFADGSSGAFVVPSVSNTVPSFSVGSNIVTPLLSIVSGSGQSARPGQQFASALKLKLVNQSTLAPLANWSVNFRRPSTSSASAYLHPSSGGSDAAVFATDANGEISLRAYATAIAGSYVITASAAGGNEVNFNLSNTAPHSFTIATGSTPQSAPVNTDFTIAIGGLVKDTNGDPAAGVGVAFSGPASGATAYLYEAGSANGVASTVTDANGRFSLRARANGLTGSYTIRASVPGVGTFDYALTNTISKSGQTITFTKPADVKLAAGLTVPLVATASSGLAVTFTSMTTSMCTVAGTTATILTAGTCTIKASQAGNASFAAAADVTQSFGVNGVNGVPRIAASATVAPTSFSRPGETLEFTIVLTNSGGVAATGIKLTDARLREITCPSTTIAPGGQLRCQASTLTTADDLATGTISVSPQITLSYAGVTQ